MAALEAAFSRCAIVANDISSYREIWGEAALYFRANDSESLATVIRRLHEEPGLCRHYAIRAYQRARECFTARRMVDEYLRLYHGMGSRLVAA
jgi:glycosyltransferase involved in cell wall biosynthesis